MSDAPPPDTPPGRDVSISMERAATLAVALLPPLVAPILLPFWLLRGWDALKEGLLTAVTPWILVPALLLSILLHEGLHALGFLLFGRAPRHAVHFGIHRATLSPFAGCRAPISARAYRAAVILPALALGVLPAAVGLATGDGFLAVWGAFMLHAAAGDLIVLWTIREVPGSAPVLDHPERVGCRVLDPAPRGP